MKKHFDPIESAQSFAQIIAASVREPLLLLDADFRILFASCSFHRVFQSTSEQTQNRKLFALDDGAWEIPALRELLHLALTAATEGSLEISQAFPRIGTHAFLLHVHKAPVGDGRTALLLSFEDVTERRAIEHERERLKELTASLLQQKEMLLEEMQHRIVNSLQIIASILMLKARTVNSEETRKHLQDAHRRVMSIAAVQQHLHSSAGDGLVEIGPYLSKLCDSLSGSMIDESNPAALKVAADPGAMTSASVVSLGLIVTELVINALKYAFPHPGGEPAVKIRYEVNGTDWKLTVSDNGVGRLPDSGTAPKGGLGTSLVKALADQLDAKVETDSASPGLSVSITHATFTSLPQAAA